jgi:hypothetical protein
MPDYTELLADISLDPAQKQYRRIADMISDILDDETGDIAMRIAATYFPDEDLRYTDEFADEGVYAPLRAQSLVWNASIRLGMTPPHTLADDWAMSY